MSKEKFRKRWAFPTWKNSLGNTEKNC